MVYTGFVSVGSSSILIPGSRTCFLKLFTWPVVLDADYIYIYTHTLSKALGGGSQDQEK